MLCVGKLLGYRTQSFVSAHKRNQDCGVVSIATDHLALNRENECTGPWLSHASMILVCSSRPSCFVSSTNRSTLAVLVSIADWRQVTLWYATIAIAATF